MTKTFKKRILGLAFILAITFSAVPNNAHAIVFVPVNTMLETAPTAVKRTVDTTMLQVKNYVLDGLAWSVAKIMLQQVTASVVNWINTGFQGSPAFLTNPGAFFADTADQITGAFIANTGALSQLCSPFSIDIRLGLALSGGVNNKRYACTLNTLIQNVQKSTVTVNGQVTSNGQTVASGGVKANGAGQSSINGFMNGDFSQGGWPAFTAMTTQPQNNFYGAYLQAESDLRQQIANKQNSIRLDLQMGRGFMSWQKCSNINSDQDLEALNQAGFNLSGTDYYSGASNSLTESVDPETGETFYRNCETETPGSVIAGSIDKSLGIPQDTLNIAGSINQIVGALFAQLVSKVLSGGLHASSNYSSSGSATAGVATQLLQQNQGDQLSGTKSQLSSSLSQYTGNAAQYVSLRQQAVSTLTASKSAYQQAVACFEGKTSISSSASATVRDIETRYAQNEIASINAAMAKVDAAIAPYQSKLNDANAGSSQVSNLQNEINSAQTTDQINQASNDYNALMQSGAGSGLTLDLSGAQSDLTSAQSQAQVFAQDAQRWQADCNSFTP